MIVCVAVGAGCKAHTQELAVALAAHEFFGKGPVLCSRQNVDGEQAKATAISGELRLRDELTPWIVGRRRYLVEGCGRKAIYTCESNGCARVGNIEPIAPAEPVVK